MSGPTTVWMIAFNPADNYYYDDPDDISSIIYPEYGFFLTEEEATAKLYELDEPIRRDYQKYVLAQNADNEKNLREYKNLKQADRDAEARNKVLKAAGFSTTPIPARPEPRPVAPQTYSQFREASTGKRYLYSIERIDRV